jgi:hypothetical protein
LEQPPGDPCGGLRGGDWFRLRTWRQGKRAEEADVVSRIGRRKTKSAKQNSADSYALAA